MGRIFGMAMLALGALAYGPALAQEPGLPQTAHILGATALSIAALGARPPAVEQPSLLRRCWTPEALMTTDKELKSVRSKAPFDLARLRQETPVPVPQELRGSIRSVELPEGQKRVALTFDLCETDAEIAGYDGRVVDLLRAQGIKATFFAAGKWLETHGERAQQLMADPNFEIGNHGLLHRDLKYASDKTINEEILLAEAAYARARKALLARSCAARAELARAVPKRMSLIRFPFWPLQREVA